MTKQEEGMLIKTLKEIASEVTELRTEIESLKSDKELQVMEIRSRKEPK